MEDLLKFLQSQRVLILSTVDGNGKPWVSNVYFSTNDKLNLFFVSPTFTEHAKHLEENSEVAFSTVWFNPDNLADRKGVQGRGICERIKNGKDIVSLLQNHYKYYPLWKDTVTHENMVNNIIQSRPYLIKPTYIKFWNDELYGEEGTEEFRFDS